VQGTLAVLLPTEDVRNAALRALAQEILAETILGRVVLGKMAESAVAWDMITNGINAARRRREVDDGEHVERDGGEGRSKAGPSRLDQYGLLSGPGLAEEEEAAVARKHTFAQTASSLATALLAALNYGLLLLLALRAAAPALLAARSLPSRASVRASVDPQHRERGKQRAVLKMGAWSLAASATEFRERMPWLAGLLALAQHASVDGPAAVGRADGRLDRSVSLLFLFYYTFRTLRYDLLGWTGLDHIAPTESRHPACAFNGCQ
jgi:PXA domain